LVPRGSFAAGGDESLEEEGREGRTRGNMEGAKGGREWAIAPWLLGG